MSDPPIMLFLFFLGVLLRQILIKKSKTEDEEKKMALGKKHIKPEVISAKQSQEHREKMTFYKTFISVLVNIT